MAVITVKAADLTENYRRLKEELGDVLLLAFLKGDGYGLGADWLAKILWEAGQRIFCTARADEALRLRMTLPEAEIWLCSVYDDPELLTKLAAARIVPTVDSVSGLERLKAASDGQLMRCHVAVDTGMGRDGLREDQLDGFISAYKLCTGLQIVSVFTHYANCYGGHRGEKATMAQNARFWAALERFKAAGVETGLHHACNSAAALLYPGLRMDAVRIGSGLLGRCVGAQKAGLIRVGELCAPVVAVHELGKGDTLGYGSVWKARRPQRVALVEAGHCDGLFLNRTQDGFRLSDRFSAAKHALFARRLTATVNGKRFRVAGRVGMTHLALSDPRGKLQVGDVAAFDFNPVLAGAREVLHA